MQLINGWTKQRVLDQVKKYNNGARARVACEFDGRLKCAYITTDGSNRCAVGAFIPDGHEALSSKLNASALMRKYPDLQAYMPFNWKNFDGLSDIERFQLVHDNASDEEVHEAIRKFLNEKVE